MIRDAGMLDIFAVALEMRDSDYAEFAAVYPVDGRERLAKAITDRYAARDDLIAACDPDGKPIAIGAAVETRPNVITLLFFATDRLPAVGLLVTRFITKSLFPRLRDAGVHRIECVSMEGHDAAHRWIMKLGLKPEARLDGFGKNGERFISFAWVRDDVRKISYRR